MPEQSKDTLEAACVAGGFCGFEDYGPGSGTCVLDADRRAALFTARDYVFSKIFSSFWLIFGKL